MRALIRRRPLWALAAVMLAGGAMILFRAGGDVQEQQSQEQQLRTLANPLAAVCTTDPVVRARLGDAVCATAQSVAPAAGPPGESGGPGDPGKGIVTTAIRADGHLVVTYSDGSVMDAGPVVGKPGTDGQAGRNGQAGRGIERSEVVDGGLVVTYSGGATENLGPVVGAKGAAGEIGSDGRGIDGVAVVEGRLIVQFTDGTTEDAGEVPVGPMGPTGERGAPGQDAELPAQYTRTFTDGTSETCSRANDDDSSPVWSCTDRA